MGGTQNNTDKQQQQQQNHRLRMDTSLSHHQMHFTVLDSDVVKTQKLFTSHGGFLTNAMNHHRETIK